MAKSKDQVVQNVRGHGLCQVLKCQELGLMFHQSVRQIPKSFFANGIIEDCHKLSPKSPLFSNPLMEIYLIFPYIDTVLRLYT